jgi:N-terminal acetyltransferase B complex non-catalytic subunit
MLTFIKRDRNWLEFLSVLDTTLPRQVSSSHSEQCRQDVEAKITHSKALFSKIAEEDGLKDRSAFLALLELDKRSLAHGLSKGRYYLSFASITFVDKVRQIRVGWPH